MELASVAVDSTVTCSVSPRPGMPDESSPKGRGHDRLQSTFEDVFTASSLHVDWFVVAGNHDHRGDVRALWAKTLQTN